MATKNNRRTVMTKRLLKEALMELMQSKPISRITIKEICDLSEMSRSTFYLHYQDQYALLKDIEDETISITFEKLKKLDSEPNSIEAIELFLDCVRENRSTFGILFCQPENESFQKAMMENVQKYIRSIVPAYHSDEKDRLLYSFVMHGSLSVIRDWISSDFQLPSRDVAEVIFHACDRTVKP